MRKTATNIRLQTANQLLQLGHTERAEALYLQELTANPGNIDTIRSIAGFCRKHQKTDLAINLLEIVTANLPDNVIALNMLADMLRERGRLDEAMKYSDRSLKLDPDQINVLTALSANTRYTEETDKLNKLENLYSNKKMASGERLRIAFALGKAFDELGQFEKAFRFFRDGNRIAKNTHLYSIEKERLFFEEIKSVFDDSYLLRNRNNGLIDKTPIFITGLPRSGTTLIEQILSSHPKVYGGGELHILRGIIRNRERINGQAFPKGFGQLSPDVLRDMAGKFVFGLKRLATNEIFVTDKNLLTSFYIGLIAVMLTEVKIIHCRRDPRDVGLSLYQIYFGGEQPQSYDLETIGVYQRLYLDLMEYWMNLLPGRILEVKYEDVVNDPDKNILGLLNYCELEYDPACSAFHETDRAVRTASHNQVRRPIYTSSIGRWKNYEQQLQPLIRALGL